MKQGKKILTVVMIIGFSMSLWAGGAKEDGKRIVGISKIVTHPALDALEKGIIDQLKDDGFTDLVFDVQSANGDVNTAASIASK